MRIAVIGSGVSGLGAALALGRTFDVSVFEADSRPGGHANTALIEHTGRQIAVDTGFIVYNEANYPLLTRLFEYLGVPTRPSDMSFSLADEGGREWSSNGVGGLFAWRRNLFDPGHLSMLAQIVRFSKQARADLAAGSVGPDSLGEYLDRHRFGPAFRHGYLLPMGAAIWSSGEGEMMAFPAHSFLRFFDNHRLLHTKRPRWSTVLGGSISYVSAITARLGGRLRLSTPVRRASPTAAGVELSGDDGSLGTFDHVVFACHSDQAMAMLPDSAAAQRRLLGQVRYAPNRVVLHRDPRLMPRRRAAWASWNYLRRRDGKVGVSYWMNLLQGLDPTRDLFVTLNPPIDPDPELTFSTYSYDHPQFDREAMLAQAGFDAIQGQGGLWFAGAWLGYGFHEDGLRSGLHVAQRIGASLPWEAAADAHGLHRALPVASLEASDGVEAA